MKWIQFPLTSYFSPWSFTIWHAHPPYDRSISFSTDHLKLTESNSSTKKIKLISMNNSQTVAHKSWVARCFPSTPGFGCNNLYNFDGFNLSLPVKLPQRFLTPWSTLRFLILQINYFQFTCMLVWSYVLPHNPHLYIDIVEENLSKPGFKQRNFDLTTIPHFPTWNIGLNLHPNFF